MKTLYLWILAAASVVVILLTTLVLVYLAFLSPWAPVALCAFALTILARYTWAESILEFIKWKL